MYMQLYFPAIPKDFFRNAQNYMCMQHFSAYELTTGEIPEMENTQQPHSYLASHMLIFFFSWVWGLEQLSYMYMCTPIHNSTTFSSHVRFLTITTAVLKGTRNVTINFVL